MAKKRRTAKPRVVEAIEIYPKSKAARRAIIRELERLGAPWEPLKKPGRRRQARRQRP
jgi:hypothetical protein